MEGEVCCVVCRQPQPTVTEQTFAPKHAQNTPKAREKSTKRKTMAKRWQNDGIDRKGESPAMMIPKRPAPHQPRPYKSWLTTAEIAEKLGCTQRTAQRIVNRLPPAYKRTERCPGGQRLLGLASALPYTKNERGNPNFQDSGYQSELASRTRIRRK